jgi:hypothetical protein
VSRWSCPVEHDSDVVAYLLDVVDGVGEGLVEQRGIIPVGTGLESVRVEAVAPGTVATAVQADGVGEANVDEDHAAEPVAELGREVGS